MSEKNQKKGNPPQPRVLVILPAFNEEEALPDVLHRLQTRHPGFDIVVVDDASTDRTREIVSAMNIPVISLPINTGIGGAEQTGFLYAWDHHYDIAIKMDSDGQHDPNDLSRLLAPILEQTADTVIGSRFLSKKGFQTTFYRRIGSRLFRFLNRLFIGQTLTDPTSGFRAYNRQAFGLLKDNYPTDYPEPEMYLFMKNNSLRILEVPVIMKERQGGSSSIFGWKPFYFVLKGIAALIIEYSRGHHE